MSRHHDPLLWRKWLLPYLATVAIGSVAVLGSGLLPPEWFAGWLWWERLLLVLLGSPFIIVAYVTCERLVEVLFRAVASSLKDRTLHTAVALVGLAALLYAFVRLFRL